MAPKKRIMEELSTRITTRSKQALTKNENILPIKRKADASPTLGNDLKRSALGELSNAKVFNNQHIKGGDKEKSKKITKINKAKDTENVVPPLAPVCKAQGRYSLRNNNNNNATNQTVTKPKDTQKEVAPKKKTRLSADFEKSGESLYSTALEDM